MKRSYIFGGAAAVAAISLAVGYGVHGARAGGIPQAQTLAYSGTLLTNGQPDAGSHFIIVKLWRASDNTLACSTIPSGNTQLVNGRFSVPFDAACVDVVHDEQDVEVEVVVDGTSMGKAPLAAVPYAVEADTASNPAPGSAIDALVPPGTVSAFAGVVGGAVPPPPGWLLCDGSAVSRTTYARLFATIGTTAGAGDGATTFNLPDLRGRFLRGVDQGVGRDPDATSRGPMAVGGNTGDAVGTVESGIFGSHGHGISDPGHSHPQFVTANPGACPGSGIIRVDYAGDVAGNACGYAQGMNTQVSGTGVGVLAAGGSETRPINASVNFLIKI